MKTKYFPATILFATISFLMSCNNTNSTQQEPKTDSNNATTAANIDPAKELSSGDYCFLGTVNKDSTTVNIRVLSPDDIRGEMVWRPWEKDGAVGSLTGKMNANKEMEFVYDYVIEGSRQTETKIMKIEEGKLYIKKGELIDPKYDGNLIYKDVTKAQYTEILEPVLCGGV